MQLPIAFHRNYVSALHDFRKLQIFPTPLAPVNMTPREFYQDLDRWRQKTLGYGVACMIKSLAVFDRTPVTPAVMDEHRAMAHSALA